MRWGPRQWRGVSVCCLVPACGDEDAPRARREGASSAEQSWERVRRGPWTRSSPGSKPRGAGLRSVPLMATGNDGGWEISRGCIPWGFGSALLLASQLPDGGTQAGRDGTQPKSCPSPSHDGGSRSLTLFNLLQRGQERWEQQRGWSPTQPWPRSSPANPPRPSRAAGRQVKASSRLCFKPCCCAEPRPSAPNERSN